MDFNNIEVDIGGQEIEKFDANPYELVIALSKKAREFNTKAMKYLGPETEIKPISFVLDKLYTEEDIEFSYEKEEAAPEPLAKPGVAVKTEDKADEPE